MALNTMIKRLTDKKAAYDKELALIGKSVAKDVAKEIGALLPPGYGLKWTQGTPSFNDGDPCTFSVHDPSLVRLAAEEEDEEEEEDFDDEVDTDAGDEESDDESDDEDEEPDDDGETCVGPDEMELSTAVTRYGKKDKARSESYGNWIEHGFPKIEGYTLETLKNLDKLWRSLPEDLLQAAFGDGAEVTVQPDGTFENDEYYCE